MEKETKNPIRKTRSRKPKGSLRKGGKTWIKNESTRPSNEARGNGPISPEGTSDGWRFNKQPGEHET